MLQKPKTLVAGLCIHYRAPITLGEKQQEFQPRLPRMCARAMASHKVGLVRWVAVVTRKSETTTGMRNVELDWF
eukprot:3455659-Amphidinium_carterae.1